MIKRTVSLLSAVMALLILLSSCSIPGSFADSVLKVGVEGIPQGFNPFYFDKAKDGIIMQQLFESLRRPGSGKKPEKLCGSITYETLEDGKVKFTVSIDDSVKFCDGTPATIDDIIFYYHVLGDASYNGPESDWYKNDIVGLREYYYDDPAWEKNLAAAVEGSELSAEQAEKEYIEKNYSNGVNVKTISGISKVNDSTCTVLCSSFNVELMSALEPLILSKAVYGAGYVKGKADVIEQNNSSPVGTGPFRLESADKSGKTAVLKANEYYYGETPGFSELRFVSLGDGNAANAIKDKKVDVIEIPALQSDIDSVSSQEYSSFLSDCDNYVSMIFNCETLDLNVRLGLMRLADRTLGLGNYFGTHYTALFRPMSVRFAEYPSASTDFPFEALTASDYFRNAGFIPSDSVGKSSQMKNEQGETLTVNIICAEDKSEAFNTAFQNCCATFKAAGIDVNGSVVSAEEYQKALEGGTADAFFGRIYEDSSSDKSSHYSSGGEFNYSRVSDENLDSLLAAAASAADLSERSELINSALSQVLMLGAELPFYQQKRLSAFNTEVIDAASLPQDADPEGCRYILKTLKPA